MSLFDKLQGKSKEAEPPVQWHCSADGRPVVNSTSVEREFVKHVESLQRKINRPTTEFTSSTDSHESEKQELRDSHQKVVDQQDKEIKNLRHAHDIWRARAAQIHEQELLKWRNACERKEQEVLTLQQNHAFEKRQLLKEHEERAILKDQNLQKVTKRYEDQIGKLNREQIARDQTAHANAEAICDSYEADTARREVGFTKERAERRAEIDQLRRKSGANQARLAQEHRIALLQFEESRRADETFLKADHHRKMQSFLKELRETNAALLSRDNNPDMGCIFTEIDLKREPDEHIKAQFPRSGANG